MMMRIPAVKVLLKLVLFLLVTAVALAIPYFWLRLDPAQAYGFGPALLHGFFWGQNLALALWDGRLATAAQPAGGYWAGFGLGLLLAAVVWYLVNGALKGIFMVIDEV
ncbi:MAG: hypothetical protein ACE5GO_11420 [Anaerolineales bacterium]